MRGVVQQIAQGRRLQGRSLLLQPVNLRNHRKIVVVDGTVAFSGGVNIGNEYQGQMTKIGQWRDTEMIEFESTRRNTPGK